MKYSFFLFLMLFSLNSFGQPEYDERLLFAKVQGGLILDSGESRGFAGFNYLNLGISKYKKLRIDGIELEIVAFDQIIERQTTSVTGTSTFLGDWNYEEQSFELSVFRLYPLVNTIRNGVFVGPYISAGYRGSQLEPVEFNNGFPRDSKYSYLGLGGKIDYYAELTDKIFLTIGVKLNFFSVGIDNVRVNNPALSEEQQKFRGFDGGFLIGKIPLSLGVSFSI